MIVLPPVKLVHCVLVTHLNKPCLNWQTPLLNNSLGDFFWRGGGGDKIHCV